jgi:hypothetical protein
LSDHGARIIVRGPMIQKGKLAIPGGDDPDLMLGALPKKTTSARRIWNWY